MVYLADSLEPFLEACEQPIMETDMVRPKEVRKFLKMLYDLNKFLRWKWCIVENCVQTERAAKEFSKILKREIATNKDYKPKLAEGDVIIYLEFLEFPRSKSMLYLKKVTHV